MRLNESRISPVEKPDWTADQAELMHPLEKTGEVHNIFKTLANHPKMFKRWRVFGNHVLFKSSLSARDRELLILRTGWNCRAGYEWGHHVPMAKSAGLSDEEIQRVTAGPDAPGWDPVEAALLRAADELTGDAFITDATWSVLAERYSTQQMMDIVFAVGHYNLVSMALNSFGVQQDEGFVNLPE